MKSQPLLDSLLHLAIFIASVGALGVVAVAVVERIAGSGTPVIKKRHVFVAFAVLAAAVVAERIYHIFE